MARLKRAREESQRQRGTLDMALHLHQHKTLSESQDTLVPQSLYNSAEERERKTSDSERERERGKIPDKYKEKRSGKG